MSLSHIIRKGITYDESRLDPQIGMGASAYKGKPESEGATEEIILCTPMSIYHLQNLVKRSSNAQVINKQE